MVASVQSEKIIENSDYAYVCRKLVLNYAYACSVSAMKLRVAYSQTLPHPSKRHNTTLQRLNTRSTLGDSAAAAGEQSSLSMAVESLVGDREQVDAYAEASSMRNTPPRTCLNSLLCSAYTHYAFQPVFLYAVVVPWLFFFPILMCSRRACMLLA